MTRLEQVLRLLADVTSAQPHLYMAQGMLRTDPEADPSVWPLYVYGHSEMAGEVWRALAGLVGARHVAEIRDLKHVWADLNTTSHAALETGVIWIHLYGELTLRKRRIGVTFHPLEAGEDVHLITPKQWHELLFVTFPELSSEYHAAQRAVTYTTAADDARYDLMTMVMRSVVRRAERGIETGVPSMPVSPEAFGLFTPEYMKQLHLIPFRVDQVAGVMHAFVSDLDDPTVGDRVYRATGLTLQVTYMEPADEAAFWAEHDAAMGTPAP